jgi:hypothetical protein
LLVVEVLGVVESDDGATAVLEAEMVSPTAEMPDGAGAGAGIARMLVVELVAAEGAAALWPPGDNEVAGAVPLGVTTSPTPVAFAVLAPAVVLVVAGAGR